MNVVTAGPAGVDTTSTSIDPESTHEGTSTWPRRLGSWLVSTLGERCDVTFHNLKPSTRRQTALLDARTAFRHAIADLPRPAGAGAALEHIRGVRSLEALWELRNEIFCLISRHRDQEEAARRIAKLDRHFSRRLRRTAVKRTARLNHR